MEPDTAPDTHMLPEELLSPVMNTPFPIPVPLTSMPIANPERLPNPVIDAVPFVVPTRTVPDEE
jgi:hypothetical protein